MSFPAPETPLYNHPLPQLEQWLTDLGFKQNQGDRHCWSLEQADWDAQLLLETEDIVVYYFPDQPNRKIVRSFKYSLSRQDIEAAILEGP
ncbi:MAG: hypothetical protein RLZZ568_1759 [Cyanobacteriota bacterium]|jgi:hypothetical protein